MAWQDAVGAIELISFVISSQWILAYSKVKTPLIVDVAKRSTRAASWVSTDGWCRHPKKDETSLLYIIVLCFVVFASCLSIHTLYIVPAPRFCEWAATQLILPILPACAYNLDSALRQQGRDSPKAWTAG